MCNQMMKIKTLCHRYLPSVLSGAVFIYTLSVVTSPSKPSDVKPLPPIYGVQEIQKLGANLINVTSTSTTVASCKIFTSQETRSFIEKEPPQTNHPKAAVETDPRGFLGRIRKIRLAVVACSYHPEFEEPRFRFYADQIIDLFHPASLVSVVKIKQTTHDDPTKSSQWNQIQMLAFGNQNLTSPINTGDIATCRNELLKTAYEIRAHYMLVADVNLFSVNTSSFLDNFLWDSGDWSVLTGNLNKEYYYDFWSLRTISESNFNEDVWSRAWSFSFVEGYCKETVINSLINIHKKNFPGDNKLFQVRSAFGGAALYNLNATIGCQYVGGSQISEHVTFNRCVREINSGRIFINPKFTQ